MDKKNQNRSNFEKLEKLPPLKTMVYFAIAGISLLFLAMLIAFIATQPDKNVLGQYGFPKAFVISTTVIALSSLFAQKTKKNFAKDDIKALKNNLLIMLCFALLFAGAQLIGWKQLMRSGIYLQGQPSGAFLYVLSGLHLLHLAGGLIFLTITIIKVYIAEKDPVKRLIFFSDKIELFRLQTLVTYWHFLGIVWTVLFLYFVWAFVT